MPDFKFNPETHTYSLDGVILPSVTTILKAEGLMNHFDTGDSEWYMSRGSHIHKAIELYLRGRLDENALDPALRFYLVGFKAFMSLTGFRVEGIEAPKYHPTHLYAGTPDIWGNGILIDIKSGTPARWHNLQLAAYAGLLNESGHPIREAYVLYLSGNGKISVSKSLKSKEIRHGLSVFLSALTIYKYKQEAA